MAEQKEKKDKKEIFRVIKYALIAASAGLIQMGSFALFNAIPALKDHYYFTYLPALVLSVIWNFTINRKYTFKSANNIPIAMLKVAAYYAVFTPLSTILGEYLTNIGWNEYLVTILNMLINFITEFLYQRFFVFGKSIDTNEKAKEEEKQ